MTTKPTDAADHRATSKSADTRPEKTAAKPAAAKTAPATKPKPAAQDRAQETPSPAPATAARTEEAAAKPRKPAVETRHAPAPDHESRATPRPAEAMPAAAAPPPHKDAADGPTNGAGGSSAVTAVVAPPPAPPPVAAAPPAHAATPPARGPAAAAPDDGAAEAAAGVAEGAAPVVERPKPPAKPVKPEEFLEGDHVVYPTHGVGKVERIAIEEIAGHRLELIHITFEENRMTLRVPVAKARTAGLRKLATRKMFDEALAVLRGRARIKRTMWSRRAQEYEAKINSGNPLSIAEVVRDLHRNAGQPDQSFSERQIYEAAMDRLAAELAALDRTDKSTAAVKLSDFLKTV